MARTKARRLSQAGRRGVDAGVGDTTRTAREGAAFPPPAQEPSERESLARACPETPSTSDSPPTQPTTSADRASDDDARVARSPRDAFAALVAPRATRRAPVRDRPTDNLPGVHAASGVPALARQAPPAEPRVEATPKGAHRALLATRPRCAQHPRAPARPRPRVPSGTLSSASRSSDAPRRDAALSVARRPAKKPGAIRRSNISRARSLALRFFLIPASRASLPGQVFASPKPSARCW